MTTPPPCHAKLDGLSRPPHMPRGRTYLGGPIGSLSYTVGLLTRSWECEIELQHLPGDLVHSFPLHRYNPARPTTSTVRCVSVLPDAKYRALGRRVFAHSQARPHPSWPTHGSDASTPICDKRLTTSLVAG